MKRLIIGRNNACDIIIPDTTDLVSRKQAALAFSFWGKMKLTDTSNNGTFVNDKRIESGKPVHVTRKDKVSFAKVAELDWNEVKDPYRNARKLCVLGAALLALVIGGAVWWALSDHEGEKKVDSTTSTEAPVSIEIEQSTTDTPKEPKKTVSPRRSGAPAKKPSPSKGKHNATPKANPNEKKDEKGSKGKDILERNNNNNIPIVY